MYSATVLAGKYLTHWLTASSGRGHGIHSPFVFEFVGQVLRNRKDLELTTLVERYRASLLVDPAWLEVEDFGAGSVTDNRKRRRVKDIARRSAKSRKWGRLLFAIARFYRPDRILELGTSLGISAAYLAVSPHQPRVVTIEGSVEVAARAAKGMQALGLKNVEVITGRFEDILPRVLKDMEAPGLVFIDGNHRRDATLSYFETCLAHSSDETLFVFDDIHWSEGMEQAWRALQQHPAVTCTIDLFFMGIVSVSKRIRHQQHFKFRY